MNPKTNPARKKANVRVIVILVAAVLLCGGVAGLVVYLHGLHAQPVKTVDSDDALIQSEGGSSRQFPVSFSNNSICAVSATEKRVCVLTQDTLNFVSSNGKKDAPIIMAGGANCEGDAGQAMIEFFEPFDYIFTGEADEILAPMCHRLLKDGKIRLAAPGEDVGADG